MVPKVKRQSCGLPKSFSGNTLRINVTTFVLPSHVAMPPLFKKLLLQGFVCQQWNLRHRFGCRLNPTQVLARNQCHAAYLPATVLHSTDLWTSSNQSRSTVGRAKSSLWSETPAVWPTEFSVTRFAIPKVATFVPPTSAEAIEISVRRTRSHHWWTEGSAIWPPHGTSPCPEKARTGGLAVAKSAVFLLLIQKVKAGATSELWMPICSLSSWHLAVLPRSNIDTFEDCCHSRNM